MQAHLRGSKVEGLNFNLLTIDKIRKETTTFFFIIFHRGFHLKWDSFEDDLTKMCVMLNFQ